MATLVTVIHVFVCLFLVLTVLLQPGKGGGMGGAFGGGSTQSVFGGSGGSSLLRKATVFVAAIFMLSSMTLAWLASNTGADALKEYSASERQRHERKESLRRAVLEGAEEGDSGENVEELGDDAPVTEPGQEMTPEELEELLDEAAQDEAAGGEAETPAGGEADEPAAGSEPAPANDEATPGAGEPAADDGATGDGAAADEGEAASDESPTP